MESLDPINCIFNLGKLALWQCSNKYDLTYKINNYNDSYIEFQLYITFQYRPIFPEL